MSRASKIIVNRKEGDGFNNILYMMSSDDFRLTDARFKDNYESITGGLYSRASKEFAGDNGKKYQVSSDWSVKEIGATMGRVK